MRKLLILLALVCVAGAAQAQWTLNRSGGLSYVYEGPLSGIPGSCNDGQLAFITDATAGENLYGCIGGAWEVQGDGAGTGSPGGVSGDLQTNNGAGGFGSVTPGAGVATWLATPSSANLATAVTGETGSGALVFATSPTLVTPALGTPASGTLTNATGLPISTGVAGLGANVATFLGTPSSANLAAAVTGETGSGALVFGTAPALASPVLTTPDLGTPSAGVLTNATGLPISTGVAGLGTGVATALGNNIGTAGAPITFNGVLGTPASGTLTNATGLPVSTGIAGLGSNVASWLATPSSSNLATAVTGETGSGALVFGTAPTFATTINIGTVGVGTGTITLNGTTSGTVTMKPADAAGTYTLTLPTSAGSASQFLQTNGAGVLTWSTPAGSGDVVGPASAVDNTLPRFDGTTGKLLQGYTSDPPTCTDAGVCDFPGGLTAPNLIAPGTLTDTRICTYNSTGPTVDCDLNSSGTGVVARVTSPSFVTPDLGTPSAATLTNATGLPVSTGISGLGSGVATFLGTPSSANLATAVTGETGSGALVFGSSPTLDSPVITTKAGLPRVTAFPGTPTAGDTVIVTDDSAAGACDSAAGSAITLCTWDGSAWVKLGDGTGAGGSLTSGDIDTSAELRGIVTDETGTGALVFAGGDIAAATATTPSANDNDTSVATTAYVQTELTDYASDTVTFTNKTFDAAATGNVFKAKGFIQLTHPDLVDGTGCTVGTTSTAIGYGRATCSNSADEAANYVEWYIRVPDDLDTSVALRGSIKFLLGGVDTGTHRYILSTVSVADSAVPTSATLANAINLDFAGDGSGASGDVESVALTTLTSWAGALTAGQTWRIRVARDGNATEDGSTVDSTILNVTLEYGKTQ